MLFNVRKITPRYRNRFQHSIVSRCNCREMARPDAERREKMSAVRCWKMASVVAILAISAGVFAQNSSGLTRLEKIDFKRHKLTPAELKGYSAKDLKFARGILFGRHGREFDEKDIQ